MSDAPPSSPQDVLGVTAVLPATWEDHTTYRFAAPPDAVPSIADPRMVAAKPPGPKFRTNLVVARHQLPADIPLAEIFDGPNQVTKSRNASFKQLGHGLATYQGQDAAWQDVSFFEAGAGLQIFQRMLAVKPDPQRVVMFTLTSDSDQLDALSRPMGFSAK